MRSARQVDWYSEVGSFTLGTGTGTATFELVPTSVLDKYSNPTITRIVGTLSFRIAQTVGATPATASNLLRMGILVWPSSSPPNPNDSPDAGWLWTKQRILYRSTPLYTARYWNGSAAVTYSDRMSNDGITVDNVDLDVRVQRVARNSEDRVWLVVHNSELVDGNQNPVCYVMVRTLVKE